MGNLEVIAHMRIRPGELEGWKAQAAEILRLTREKDTHTVRCDWFVNADGTECEVHELFPNEQGLIEHKMNTMEPSEVLFRECAYDPPRHHLRRGVAGLRRPGHGAHGCTDCVLIRPGT